MTELPPEDQPDAFWVGSIGPIPIQYEDDPRFEENRAHWSVATKRAQSMTTPDQLLEGLVDDSWRVRHEVIDRLRVRASNDDRILPALIERLAVDIAWQVRDKIAMTLSDFPNDERVMTALNQAADDENEEVRQSVAYSLNQLDQDQVD